MQQPGNANIVYVTAISESQRLALVLWSVTSNTARYKWWGNSAFGNAFNCVEYLHVPCAPTEMSTKMTCHIFTLKTGAFFVDLCFCSHHNAWNTKTALQTTACCECIGINFSLSIINAFKGDNVGVAYFFYRLLATHYCLAVYEHCAASALPRRRAAIFRRSDVQFFAQSRQQMRVAGTDGYLSTINGQRHAGRGVPVFGL